LSQTTQTLRRLKGERPIVAVTAYDTVMAGYADAAGVDLILVGDSVGTTQLGYESTVPVTLDAMVHHTAAVARARPQALLVADLPFAIAHGEFQTVLDASMRLLQEAGAEAVKIEGGAALAPTIGRLIEAGIPVLGHIGLLPQQYHRLGGYRKFGRTELEKEVLLKDAKALEAVGCFALVGEMIEGTLAGAIAAEIAAPLIGIGCGPHCDGQILVCNDLLGMNPGYVPSFVKSFAAAGAEISAGFANYVDEVRNRKFPE